MIDIIINNYTGHFVLGNRVFVRDNFFDTARTYRIIYGFLNTRINI